jgi:hypothetical protein
MAKGEGKGKKAGGGAGVCKVKQATPEQLRLQLRAVGKHKV